MFHVKRSSLADTEVSKDNVKQILDIDTTRDSPEGSRRETEIFRDSDIPKGQINVNAENGKVVLRGEVEQPELIKDLEQRTKKVQGVQEVENLLHVPGAAAPTT
jgi:osmotically-inducible protein OsmY